MACYAVKFNGDIISKITQKERMRNYYKTYGQIYEWPAMSFLDIAVNTGLSCYEIPSAFLPHVSNLIPYVQKCLLHV